MIPAPAPDTVESLATAADIIYKLGFPIFVAVYLLVRVDRILSTQVVNQATIITQNAELLGLLRDVRTAFVVQAAKQGNAQ